MTDKATNKDIKPKNSIAYYDDVNHNYEDFWVGREYEHRAELIALDKLLEGRHYEVAMDYGGGYGRISSAILAHADRLILVDPSTKQLDIAKKFLKDYHNVEYIRVDEKDRIPAEADSLDLLVMVRVSHHLPDPGPTIAEIHRSLKPGGNAIIEIANEAHFVNRMRYLRHLQAVPKQPVPIGKNANGITDNTPFVNHNPKTIERLFSQYGLKPISKLSVSNLRHHYIKEHLSVSRMLAIEKFFQGKLSVFDFGPSIFYLLGKAD